MRENVTIQAIFDHKNEFCLFPRVPLDEKGLIDGGCLVSQYFLKK
jgi:hypothetical protein